MVWEVLALSHVETAEESSPSNKEQCIAGTFFCAFVVVLSSQIVYLTSSTISFWRFS